MKTSILENGLTLIVHQKQNTELAVVNILYKVGSINESKKKTGLAHLLEHMMFEGSKNFKDFDRTLQNVLGENNAFTSQEYTNYFEILPKEHIDTALNLEIDRMQNLSLSTKKFKLQKSIVIEEYKETSINPPLSDNWHHILKLAYKNSCYQWPVIGQDIKDVKNIELIDLKKFYNSFYNPNNAILCIIADLDEDVLLSKLTLKFNPIENKINRSTNINYLPIKKYSGISKKVKRKNIHANAFYIAFHIPDFGTKEYFITDMISDFLSNGESSILQFNFIKNQPFCTEISSYITDNKKNNLLIIEGKLKDNKNYLDFKNELINVLNNSISDTLNYINLQMLKNKSEGFFIFNNYNMANLAQNLSFYTYCNIENPIKTIPEIYEHITMEDFIETFKNSIKTENMIELCYIPSSKKLF